MVLFFPLILPLQSIQKLMDFDLTNGAFGSLMQASDGKLYGMTSAGGSNDLVLFFPMILRLPLIQS